MSDFDRRELITSALVAGVAATHSAPLNATPKTERRAAGLTALPSASEQIDLRSTFASADILMRPQAATAYEPPSKMLVPIDSGADRLLRDYEKAALRFSPLDVEYLLKTLNEHVFNCLELRQRGQDLEVATASSVLQAMYENDLIKTAGNDALVLKRNRNRILSELVDAKYISDTGRVEPAQRNDPYFTQRSAVQDAYVTAKSNDWLRRREYLSQDGGASNFGQRFLRVKELFEIELKEAYQRARAVSAGLNHVYGLPSSPVPKLTSTGYLDSLVKWTRESVYALEQKLLSRTQSVIPLALASDPIQIERLPPPISRMDFDKDRQFGLLNFSLEPRFFNQITLDLKNVRIQGLEVGFWQKDNTDPKPWGPNFVDVRMPQQSVIDSDGKLVFTTRPRALISTLTLVGRREFTPVHLDAFHNANPAGNWEIRIGLRDAVGQVSNSDEVLNNLILIMTVSHDK